LFETDKGEVIAAAVNGLYDVNLVKLQHIIGAADIKLASPETVKRVTGADVGYAGFLNLPSDIRVVLDESVGGRKNFEVGANKTNYHTINVNFGRDYPEPDRYWDIAMAKEGYSAVDGQQKLIEKKGIEVGNIFQLGYHYSNLMRDTEYTDEQGRRQKYYMGCYGIGIGRTLAATVEVHHDDKGIIWPESIAPALVYLVRLGDGSDVIAKSDELYKKLQENGVEVLYDDRDLRAGEKFADADLIGVPYRLVVSKNTLMNGEYELKKRDEAEVKNLSEVDLLKLLASGKTS
jgi:prolyl-tRNA synthetase